MALDDIRNERIKKLNALRHEKIEPYPAQSTRTTTITDLLSRFEDASRETIAGRVMAIREHVGSLFCDLYDGTGRMQGYLKENELGEKFKFFNSVVDIGDFIDLTGAPFTTKRGEKSLLASDWRMLSKSLLPLPEKWHGITDPDERLRRRYLDILFNDDVRT